MAAAIEGFNDARRKKKVSSDRKRGSHFVFHFMDHYHWDIMMMIVILFDPRKDQTVQWSWQKDFFQAILYLSLDRIWFIHFWLLTFTSIKYDLQVNDHGDQEGIGNQGNRGKWRVLRGDWTYTRLLNGRHRIPLYPQRWWQSTSTCRARISWLAVGPRIDWI